MKIEDMNEKQIKERMEIIHTCIQINESLAAIAYMKARVEGLDGGTQNLINSRLSDTIALHAEYRALMVALMEGRGR